MSKINYKDTKFLKSITIVILVYSALIFLQYIIELSGIFIEPSNPLIPKFLPYYIAYPSIFLGDNYSMLYDFKKK